MVLLITSSFLIYDGQTIVIIFRYKTEVVWTTSVSGHLL